MKIPLFLLLSIFACFTICLSLKGVVNMEIIHEKCFHRSIGQIIRCQLTFQNNVKKSTGKRPFNVNMSEVDEEQLKTVCCGLWDMTSCMKGAAIKWSNCQPDSLRMFSEDMDSIGTHQEYSQCFHNYREGSIKCGFPMWATITLVVISIIILATVTCFVHKICKRRSQL